MTTSVAPTILPLFSTPFGLVTLADAEMQNAALAPLLFGKIPAGNAADLSYRSSDDLLEQTDDPIVHIKSSMLEGVLSVLGAVGTLDAAALRALTPQLRGWFTLVRRNGCVPATCHPLTAWCAVYCVQAPPPCVERIDGGVLRLYEYRLGSMFADATNAGMRVPYTLGHYSWRPAAGELAVFPGHLAYEVALQRAPGCLLLLTMRLRFVGAGQTGMTRW